MPMILRDFIFHIVDTMAYFCPNFSIKDYNMDITQSRGQA